MNEVNSSWLEQIQIDQTASDPLFLQVKEALADWIRQGLRDGTLSPGDRVPSERDLSENLNVSAITVKRALNDLQQEGLIQRIQGRGSFIARPRKLVLGLERLYSLTTVALERGMTPARRCLELKEMAATESIASNLHIGQGEPVAKIIRLRLVDDVPLAVDTSYVPLSLFPRILEDDLNRYALYDLMTDKYQVEPIRAREYLEPTLINEFEAEALGVPVGAPAMLIARLAYGANDVPLEFNKSVIRGDMCRFYVDMLKENL
jgi:GntR family transcriptional regulator